MKFILFLLISIYPLSLFSQWNVSGDFGAGAINSIITDGSVIYAGSSTGGVYRSDNNGMNWMQVSSGFGNTLFVQTLTIKQDIVFAGTASGGVFYSDNKGANWIQSNQGLSQLNIKTMISDSERVYAGCIFAGIFSSTNNGVNWTRFGLGEGDLLFSILKNDNSFFAGIEGVIYRSTNNGVNWSMTINGLTDLRVRSLVQTSGGKIYCGTFGGGIFVSENNGDLWTQINPGLTDLQIWCLAVKDENVFAGTASDGIFALDSPLSWEPVNEGMTDTTINAIAVNNEFIFAGSSRGKVWKRHISEVVNVSEHDPFTVQDFHLEQNYPNPFNPGTNFSFYLPERNNVSLKIFNNLGAEVSEVFSGMLSEGHHVIRWNAADLPTGIYFYRLQSGQYKDTRKLVLVK